MIDKTFFENPPHICEHCKNCIIPKEGFMKGKILCVCDDKKNPKVPHVHATQLHFKCSTNQFENKYVNVQKTSDSGQHQSHRMD